MRNKQRVSQAQAAQNAKAIAQARTMAAMQALSPTNAGARNTRNRTMRQNTDLAVTQQMMLMQNQPSSNQLQPSSLISHQQQSRPQTHRDPSFPGQLAAQPRDNLIMSSSSLSQAVKQNQQKSKTRHSAQSRELNTSNRQQMQAQSIAGLGIAEPVMAAGTTSKLTNSQQFNMKYSGSKSPMSHYPRTAAAGLHSTSQFKHAGLTRSNSDALHDERLRSRTLTTTHVSGEAFPSTLASRPKNSAMITSFPQGRQRVKSLQTTGIPPFTSQTVKAIIQQNQEHQYQPIQQQSLQQPYRNLGQIAAQAVIPDKATSKNRKSSANATRSVGSRGGITSQQPPNSQPSLQTWQQQLNNTTQSSNKNGSSGPGETHIKLLVRIRPTLSTESPNQCITLHKVASQASNTNQVDSASGNDTSAMSAQNKKGTSKATIASKSDSRASEASKNTNVIAVHKQSQFEQLNTSPKIIKLSKGYNNIQFKFDQVLPEGCSQDTAFQLSQAKLIVKNFVSHGASATIFAYGQTSAGKTYTIIGGGGGQHSSKRKDGGGTSKTHSQRKLKLSTSDKKGLLPRILDTLFTFSDDPVQQFIVSFYEIYNDKVHDLLKPPTFSPQNSNSGGSGKDSKDGQVQRESLEVREKKDGNFVIYNLKKVIVNTKQEAYIQLEKGLQNRSICATSQNAASSRSHTIFQIERGAQGGGQPGQPSILRIVDLAGSEKYCYSNMSQDVKMKELSSINQSLSTLGQCISALGDHQRRHIPFRNCKLTKILKDSLMQPSDSPLQTIVALIVCISPSIDSYQETQSTLQFADRAKKAILNQGPLQITAPQSQTSAKLSAALLDNMATEMEKLRKENAELKAHMQVMRLSSSQDSLKMQPLESSSLAQVTGLSGPIRESIDLRLSEVFRDDSNVIMEVHDGGSNGEEAKVVIRPRQESSPTGLNDEEELLSGPQPRKLQLRSCFKGERAKQNMKQHKITMASRAVFSERLANDESLDFSIRERIEHNLKYNDDTIFDNLEIFQDIGETNNKVHGSKDKFNARKLLGTPIDEIPVSDDEEDKTPPAANSPQDDQAAKQDENSSVKDAVSPTLAKSKMKQANPQQLERNRIRMSAGDLQGFENTSNHNMSHQMHSLSQSNIIPAMNSFLPDMPSMNEEVPQDTLNLSNDLSNDLIELGNDKQFQNAFTKNHRPATSHHANGQQESGNDDGNILIQDEDDDFLKFDANDKHQIDDGDSLPFSNSLAFGDQPGATNLSNILEQSNPYSKRIETTIERNNSDSKGVVDMFKPQDKLFLNDMSNILRVEEQLTQRSIDKGTGCGGGNQQLQSTLILDEEEEEDGENKNANDGGEADRRMGHCGRNNDDDEDDYEDTIAGMLNSGGSGKRNNLQLNISSGDQAMISFDASRISPSNTNANNHLDTSHANMKNMVGQLTAGSRNAWQNSNSNFGLEQISEDGRKRIDSNRLDEELTDPDDQLIRPQEIEKSAKTSLLQDVHAGSLFARNHKKQAIPQMSNLEMAAASVEKSPHQLDSCLNHDEILTYSLTNTFSTIQSLGGELNALRNNLEMSKKHAGASNRKRAHGNVQPPHHQNDHALAALNEVSGPPQRLSQGKKNASQADRMSKAPVSGARGVISQSSNTPLKEISKQRDGFIYSKRLQVRRSQERLDKKSANQQKLLVPFHPTIVSPLLGNKSKSRKEQKNSGAAATSMSSNTVQAAASAQRFHPTSGIQVSASQSQTLSVPKTNSAQGQHPPSQQTATSGTTMAQSKIIPGNRIDQIRETPDEEEDSSEITDQSMSLDLTSFAKDLQSYYNKIHSEIAQLKDILLRTQHEQKQAFQTNESEENLTDGSPVHLAHANSGQRNRMLEPQTFDQRNTQQQLALAQASSMSPQQPPRSHMSATKGANSGSSATKVINKDAILRAQELIEQIKTEILNGFSKQQHQLHIDTPPGESVGNFEDEDSAGVARQGSLDHDDDVRIGHDHDFEDGDEEDFNLSAPLQGHQASHRSKKAAQDGKASGEEQDLAAMRASTQGDLKKHSAGNFDNPMQHQQKRQVSSAMTFHPNQVISEPTMSEIEALTTTQEQMLTKQQRNMSSQNVVSLLQRLQNELLESIPPDKRHHDAMTQQLFVQKRLDMNPAQYEEIEGSQERSPYVVRHMQVQRQNWIKIEDSKTNNHGRQLFTDASDRQKQQAHTSKGGRAGAAAGDNGKRSLEDTADVNVTNTSAVMFGDQSQHVIQRPLPVNRIQQKITKDLTYGLDMQQQHHLQGRAPRSSPKAQRKMLKEAAYSPDVKGRNHSNCDNPFAASAQHGKQGSHTDKVQGPKITGIGTGSVAADHTLTLIFDSDEEIHHDAAAGGALMSDSKGHDQKRLSEIVEDYLDEGNLTPTNNQNQRGQAGSQKSQHHRHDHSGNMLHDDDNPQFDFGAAIESQPFQKASGIKQANCTNGTPTSNEDGVEREQHSFMQESSLQNLFPARSNHMLNIDGEKCGTAGQSRYSRQHDRSSSRTMLGLPQFTQFGSESGGQRLSEINMPIMQLQKQQDMSHLSDDDLQFFLGSQGLNHGNTNGPNNAVSSMIEPHQRESGSQHQPQHQLYDQLFHPGSSNFLQPTDKRGNSAFLGSFPPMRAHKSSSSNIYSNNDYNNLYEIKETDKEAENNQVQMKSGAATTAPPQTAAASQQKTASTGITAAQKWVAPPRIKNLRSKKNRAMQQQQNQLAKAAPAGGCGTASGVKDTGQQPEFHTRQTIFHDDHQASESVQPGTAAAKDNSEFTGTNSGAKHDQAVKNKDVAPIGNQIRPAIMACANNVQHGYEPALPQTRSGVQLSQKPLMAGSGQQAANPQLNQSCHPPPHQHSMEIAQDMSRYSENFDEEDYQEQTNNSSSKQSVHKYFFQFFNPSAKLHIQQKQFKAQSAFRQSNNNQSQQTTVSAAPATAGPVSRASTGVGLQASEPGISQSISQTQHIPTGLAAGIPRSSGKKSPLTTTTVRTQQHQHKQPSQLQSSASGPAANTNQF